ncbi:MAG: hypothetical protein ACI4SS_06365 [Clostridia bacterium]
MGKAPAETVNPKEEIKKNTNNVKNQNQHYNVKKEALGPNAKRGR